MSTDVKLPQTLNMLRSIAPILAGVGLIGGLIVALLSAGLNGFWQAWLYGWILWFGLSLGSIALLCIHHMTGGAWSFVSQRIMEAASRVLPVWIVLFIPIWLGPKFGLNNLYDAWVKVTPEQNEIIYNKVLFLDPEFWMLRAVVYFAIWTGIMYLLNRWSKQLDDTGDGLIVLKFRRFAPPALIVYCLTMTLAATDWVMSLEPEWYSTIYGPLFWISQGLSVLAFSIIILSFLAEEKPLSRFVTIENYHHLANLMLGFTVIWAYMSFSQYLIIWSGNLPEEITYYHYRYRSSTGWTVVALMLMFFHFLVPLLVLIHRRFKLNVALLRKGCYWMLAMRLVDVFWFINPAFHYDSPGIHAADVITYFLLFLGLGGVWLWFFLGTLRQRALISLNDPRLYEAVKHMKPREAMEHA